MKTRGSITSAALVVALPLPVFRDPLMADSAEIGVLVPTLCSGHQNRDSTDDRETNDDP